MHQPLLVINAGSSSIKFAVFKTGSNEDLSAVARGQVEDLNGSPQMQISDAHGHNLVKQAVSGGGHDGAIRVIHNWCVQQFGGEAAFAGVGHRLVHGGRAYAAPTLIDEGVLKQLESLVPLAPLHQPTQIAAIRAVSKVAPQLRQVACFDTAFHRSQPALAQEYALPRELTGRGIHGYGFHGLSYEYIVASLPRVAAECAGKRLVVAHLGNGASLCAIHQSRSIATTMGMTPLDGLPMGTRCGALDPGVLLYLAQHEKMSAKAIEQLLYEQSGLLGVSGVSGDMRELEASKQPDARHAIDLFVYRIGRELGSLVAALGGLDALIFTGGIGEHSAQVRARVCHDAGWLGVSLDADANKKSGPRISLPERAPSTWVIRTDENLMIARHTRTLLDA
ncbi:MAG TPA: acetate/propionate family kinase [Steroidobacteraceae bacterium]|jgi:acetate kinase